MADGLPQVRITVLEGFRRSRSTGSEVRVGNAGVTGVVDPFGRVLDRLGMFTAESLRAEIRPLQIATVYTRGPTV